MKKVQINKKTTGNKLIVEVSLPTKERRREPIIEFSNSDLIAYLQKEGVSLEDYEVKEQPSRHLTTYSTKGNHPARYNGTWVLLKKAKKVTKKNDNKVNNKKNSTV